MKLADAFLYLDVVGEDWDVGELESFCAAAIAGGVDVVELNGSAGRSAVEAAIAACRREDALLLVAHNVSLAAEAGADGVIIDIEDVSVGEARAGMDESALVGSATQSLDEAILAVEVGVDFVVHGGGRACAGVFAQIGAEAGIPLFAAGIESRDDARALTEAGVYRLCIRSDVIGREDATAAAASFSRMLGREI